MQVGLCPPGKLGQVKLKGFLPPVMAPTHLGARLDTWIPHEDLCCELTRDC